MGERPTITYKPGWSFRWERYNDEDFLSIEVTAPDCKGTDAVTGEPREANFMFVQREPFDAKALLNRIHGIEYHELCEWFRVDGELVDNPHDRDGRTIDE